MYILSCWIEHPVRSLDRTFAYLSETEVPRGCRVQVVFGMKTLVGFVDSCVYTDESKEAVEARMNMKLRFIDKAVDPEPLISDELYELAMNMREATLSTAIS
jgi:primosomal protein N' (replication factor Y)